MAGLMTISNREDLIAELQQDSEEFQEAVSQLPDEAFERGVYEQGWNARQLLAHIAAIEWTYPRLIERAEQRAAGGDVPQGGGDGFDMDAYNAKQVARRDDQPVEQLLTEFRRNRAETIDAIRAADEELLQQPTRSAGGVEGTLLDVLEGVAVGHVREHVNDLLKGARSG